MTFAKLAHFSNESRPSRRLSLIDQLIVEADTALRTMFATPQPSRPLPVAVTTPNTPSASADEAAVPATLAPAEAKEAIRLMRVNHVGEVCAQALYQGQSMVARNPNIRAVLQHAGNEERDHLAWCASRVQALGGRTSVLSPIFYAGAWTLGVASGLAGDKWSMGFLVETERQVEAHLDEHLARLPARDAVSRAIVMQMREDEIAHGDTGEANGAMPLPAPIKAAMRLSSKVMTSTTYWV
jgi:3-demethoxyubiquinol 3-hydroxylase